MHGYSDDRSVVGRLLWSLFLERVKFENFDFSGYRKATVKLLTLLALKDIFGENFKIG